MEKIHDVEMRPWIGANLNVADFRKQWIDALGSACTVEEPLQLSVVRERIMKLMNITEETVLALEEDCR